MPLRKVNEDPFGNGSEFRWWESRNCDICVKASRYNEKTDTYTKVRCAVQRDIFTRMGCDEPIAQRTIDACNLGTCPYRITAFEQKPRKHKTKTNPNQTLLQL